MRIEEAKVFVKGHKANGVLNYIEALLKLCSYRITILHLMYG